MLIQEGRFAGLSGDPRYFALLEDMAQLHSEKAQDYGSDTDPLANIRASELLGIPAWLGAILRAGDKWSRILTFAQKRALAVDSLVDMAAYLLIATILYREEKPAQPYVDGGVVTRPLTAEWNLKPYEPSSETRKQPDLRHPDER